MFACTARPVFLRFLCLGNVPTSPHFTSLRAEVHWAGKGWSIQHSRACSSLLPSGYSWKTEEKGERAALLTAGIPPLVFRSFFCFFTHQLLFFGKTQSCSLCSSWPCCFYFAFPVWAWELLGAENWLFFPPIFLPLCTFRALLISNPSSECEQGFPINAVPMRCQLGFCSLSHPGMTLSKGESTIPSFGADKKKNTKKTTKNATKKQKTNFKSKQTNKQTLQKTRNKTKTNTPPTTMRKKTHPTQNPKK